MKSLKSTVVSFILIAFVSLCRGMAYAAPEAEFHKIWLEHNVSHDGTSCLKIMLDVTVRGAKGKDVSFIAYIESPKGTAHKDKNGKYRTKDGFVSASYIDDATYENTRWKTLGIYLPNEEIHAKPGKNTYYVQVQARVDGKFIGQSEYESFTATGASASSGNNNAAGNNANVQKINCFVCHGSGTCQICGGLGYTVSRYGYLKGQQVSCGYCTASGRCPACHGKGYTVSQYINGNLYIDGQLAPPAGSGSSSSSGRDRNSGSSSACRSCGGTGVSKTPNSGGSRSSWVAYYNPAGTHCPYCGGYTEHYHDRCSSCNIPSY